MLLTCAPTSLSPVNLSKLSKLQFSFEVTEYLQPESLAVATFPPPLASNKSDFALFTAPRIS